MVVDLNHVTLSGNLTRDPALEVLASGDVVCELHVASQQMMERLAAQRESKRERYRPVGARTGRHPRGDRHGRRERALPEIGRASCRERV